MIKASLYKHQFDSVLRFHMHYPKTADWSDCGIGKSLIALSKFSALRESGSAKNLLIVCPLSVMSSWKNEVQEHTDFKITLLTGTKDSKIKHLLDDSQIFTITYDSIAGKKDLDMFKALYYKFRGDNMIICDESSMLQSIEAKRTKALITLCDGIKFSMYLSGTFIPQDLQDVFTIYRGMDGGVTFGMNPYVARSFYMYNVGTSYPKWELRPDRKELFLNKLYERAIRLKKEDCLDLPPKVYEQRWSTLTHAQEQLYNQMRIELRVELESSVISATNILSKMTKMQQIVGGFIYDKEGISHPINSNKYQTLIEIVKQLSEEEKVVIYARFREELYNIVSVLKQNGYGCVMLHGALTEKERSNNIQNFRKEPNVKALVAQVSTGGYGLTVVEANHIIYFSMTFSLIDFLQSQDRIHRIGQTKTCIYHFLLTEDPLKKIIDRHVYDSVMRNVDVATSLSDPEALKRIKDELC